VHTYLLLPLPLPSYLAIRVAYATGRLTRAKPTLDGVRKPAKDLRRLLWAVGVERGDPGVVSIVGRMGRARRAPEALSGGARVG
jgi:hypothetical protein